MSTSWYVRIDLPFDGTPEEGEKALKEATWFSGWTPSTHSATASFDDDLPIVTTGEAAGLGDPGGTVSYDRGRIRGDLWFENLGRDMSGTNDDGTPRIDPRIRMACLLENLSAITTAAPGDVVGSVANEHHGDDRAPLLMTGSGLRYCHSMGNADVAGQGWFGHTPDPFPAISQVPTDLIDGEDFDGMIVTVDLDGLRMLASGDGVGYMRLIADRRSADAP
jgi:hypothetical protein